MAHHAEHEVAGLGLDKNRAIVEERRKHTVHAEAHIHDVAELEINYTAIEEAFLADLTEALISDDVEAKMP